MPRLPTLQGQITHLSQREKSDRDHGRTTCEVRERPKNEASVGKSPKESCPICSTRAAAVRLLREESGAFVTARETWLTSARSVWRHSFTLRNYDVEYASRNVLYAFFYWYGIFPILLFFFFWLPYFEPKKKYGSFVRSFVCSPLSGLFSRLDISYRVCQWTNLSKQRFANNIRTSLLSEECRGKTYYNF